MPETTVEIPNAKCPRCRTIFPVPMFAGLGLSVGNMMSCPQCGTPSPVEDSADGRIFGKRFSVRNAVRVLRDASIYDLEEFRAMTERARSGEISPQQAIVEASALGGGFASLMRDPAIASWLALLSLLASLYIALWQKADGDSDHDETIELLKRQVEASEELAAQYRQAQRACPSDLPPLQVAPRHEGESRQVYRARLRALNKGT